MNYKLTRLKEIENEEKGHNEEEHDEEEYDREDEAYDRASSNYGCLI